MSDETLEQLKKDVADSVAYYDAAHAKAHAKTFFTSAAAAAAAESEAAFAAAKAAYDEYFKAKIELEDYKKELGPCTTKN